MLEKSFSLLAFSDDTYLLRLEQNFRAFLLKLYISDATLEGIPTGTNNAELLSDDRCVFFDQLEQVIEADKHDPAWSLAERLNTA